MTDIDFEKSADGLIPAIVQDYKSKEVLMLAFVNRDAFEKTIETGKAHYWSRSRKKLWLKGESSGNIQLIKDILVDCDRDTIVYIVDQIGGAACHEGYPSCFFRKVADGGLETIQKRVFDPAVVYKKG